MPCTRCSSCGQPKQARTLNPHWWGLHDNGGMSRNPQGGRSSELGCVLFKHQRFNVTWLETGKAAKARTRASWLQVFCLFVCFFISPFPKLPTGTQVCPSSTQAGVEKVEKNQETRAGISSPNSKSLECNELCGDRGGLGTFRVSSGREVWGTWVCPVPCPSFCRDTLWYWDCS